MPAVIVNAAENGTLVVFAGAGVSTESGRVLPYSFYDEVASELNLRGCELSFSSLMSKFCEQADGRRRLLTMIKKRLDHALSFPEFARQSSRFHSAISTLPHLNHIVTTNWDEHFEYFSKATPIVTDQDFAYWDLPIRKVFKIHGSIGNVGSIVATDQDYEQCYQRLRDGVMGAHLKMMLATKTVLFAGYSLRDSDFSRIYSFLREQLGSVLPHAFVLTLDDQSVGRLEGMGLTPIVTDATFFIEILKQHLVANGLMLDDARFDGIDDVFDEVHRVHLKVAKIDIHSHPDVVYCLCYQDGLLDAFGRMKLRKNSGEYSCPSKIASLMATYEEIANRKLRKLRYEDVAYTRGYQNGLMYLAINDKERRALPKFFHFGAGGELNTFSELKRMCSAAIASHKRSRQVAKRLVSALPKGLVFQHTATLF